MPSESDLNLLEAYLDDALSPAQVERVDSRLTDEPDLSDAFDSLRSQRAARIAVFNLELPPEPEADEFAETVIATIHRRQWRARFIGRLRIGAGVAACLVVGFVVGWLGRGQRAVPQRVVIQQPAAVNIADPASHSHSDGHLVIRSAKAPEPGQYQVAVLDADGNVIALQRFSKLEDARQFSDDLGQFELRRQQVQESQAMLVSDSF